MAELSEALKAAAASAASKSQAGSSQTDSLRPAFHPVVEPGASYDLTTQYLGLRLKNPIVASPGPIQQSLRGLTELQDAGVGAVVLFSLFEEQIRYEDARGTRELEEHQESFAEAMTFFPTHAASRAGVSSKYLRLIESGASALTVPLIASINGSQSGDWVRMARRMQDAGAAAIELNIYYIPGDVDTDPRDVEARHLEILAGVKQAVDIPVSVKLSPFFSSVGNMALNLDRAGADGLVLFNRFVQPDIDVETPDVVSGLELSTPFEARLPRTWIAALRNKVQGSQALTTGVDSGEDVIKALLAGADVVMTTSALLRHGVGRVQSMLDGLTMYLRRKQVSLSQVRGMLAVPAEAPADEYARSGYLSAIEKAKRRYGHS